MYKPSYQTWEITMKLTAKQKEALRKFLDGLIRREPFPE
jgi:hypothetical protein